MKVVAVLLFALVLPAVAGAQAPAGFTEATVLEPAASYVAGKPVKVYCGRIETGEDGHAIAGGNEIVLAQFVCDVTLERATRRTVYDYTLLAASLLTLAHEAEHASGLSDESQTECAALRMLPSMAARFFRYTTWRSRHDLMGLAWESHRLAPADYRRAC